MHNSKEITIWISFAQEDHSFFDQIKLLFPGVKIASAINVETSSSETTNSVRMIREANLFILLISDNYLNSQFTNTEYREMVLLAKTKRIKIIPVLLEEVTDWKSFPFQDFQILPLGTKSVADSGNPSIVFRDIAKNIAMFSDLLASEEAFDAIAREMKEKTGTLNLNECDLNYVPLELLGMPWLLSLNLSGNRISKIENLEALKRLEILNFSLNKIKKIENLSQLTRLQQLSLAYNAIYVIENLASLRNLEVLDLSTNNIIFASGLTNQKKLKQLYLSGNSLQEARLGKELINLEVLSLDDNKLSKISKLGFFPALKWLDLKNNQIESIRPLLVLIESGMKIFLNPHMPSEKLGINISGNNLSEPPLEVISAGEEAIKKYFEDIEIYGSTDLLVVKLILIGNSRAGKSNFSQFIRSGKIDKNSESTQLLDIQQWNAKNDKKKAALRINIFDFGGQDYYHDAHRMFYSHDTAYILLWDKQSNAFGEQQEENTDFGFENFPIEYWLESINYNVLKEQLSLLKPNLATQLLQKIPVWVVQNKIDLPADPAISAFVNQSDLSARYPNIWEFSSVSLLTGKRTSILQEMLQEFIDVMPTTGRKLIKYEHKIVSTFLEYKQPFEILSLEKFHQRCITIISNKLVSFPIESAEVQAQILNNMGLILYDVHNERKQIFTNVLGLNKSIKELMSRAKKMAKNGLFTFKDLGDLNLKSEIIDLLSRNHSIIDLGSGHFLAPQFLIEKAPAHFSLLAKAFKVVQVRFIYQAYFHKSLLLSIYSKYLSVHDSLKTSADMTYWKNGIIISKEYSWGTEMVMLEFVKTPNLGLINIRTMHRFDKSKLEGEIASDLQLLSRGWTVSKELSLNGIDFVSSAELQQRVLANDFTYHLNGYAHGINAFKDIEHFDKLPKKVFISYSSKNTIYAKRLLTHLAVLKNAHLIDTWYDRMIESGSKWNDEIKKEMNLSDVIIFLLSPDLLATSYVMDTEVPEAIRQKQNGRSKLFFIELQACGWKDTILKDHQQTDDSSGLTKEPVLIEEPLNDAAWRTVIDELKEKLTIQQID